ncbi:TRAP transporter fused permease subunit [Haloquadratum walsbyi]|jgi:TRAP transporter, 4TM/12TM fusion protein|uniref:TRAP transporter, 4TM/12TM fusion protein n=1 Tax=Haloquadratum walsbyi J07HQW2 TaxID=1238425 RepID=U1PUZ1_9EURY|nr:TRAP transporter fused permease subunit [Haloquadratum walsbyi]ERG96211.1 MAG: TRAP transporter, 4TM/12TM fusion protein [Haloquadratum walsbyi J07HQW2]
MSTDTPPEDSNSTTKPDNNSTTQSVSDTEDTTELIDEIERRRSLTGVAAIITAAIGVLFSTFQLLLAAQSFTITVWAPIIGTIDISLQLLQANAIHVVFALVLTFLLFPATMGEGFISRALGRAYTTVTDTLSESNPLTQTLTVVATALRWLFVDPHRRRITPFDGISITAAILAATYFITDFEEIQRMRVFGLESGRPVVDIYPVLDPLFGGMPVIGDISYALLLGVIGILLVLEATRRTLGLPLMLIVATFIVYARWGYLISTTTPLLGLLAIPELTWPDIIQNLWYNTENGVFGIPVTVSVSFIYIFILFGAFLEMSGAGQWFIDLAYALTGRQKGGPAKASILASGFMGTISGSSIANTVTTGAFTIPLMKQSGYSAEFSGAVESSSSSGGQILPPVMGAAAFLMVQYTATPFADIIILATIPAVVFFFGVWVMVHLKAVEEGIGGVDKTELVSLREHFFDGWYYILPIILLLFYLIIERLSVSRSAWFTLISLVALIALVGAYNKNTRGALVTSLAAIIGVELLTHVFVGVSVIDFITGVRADAMSIDVAIDTVLPRIGWYTIAASALTLLINPKASSAHLELNPSVLNTIEDVTSRTNTNVGDYQLFRLGTFVFESMEDGARTAVPVVIAVAAAGIIPGVISVSGLGPNLTSLLLVLSGGSVVIMLVVTAFASIILGMGMPTTVTYIILISMLASPLVEFGIPLLAAHLFILYFGVIADITPPVAVAAYAASGVAKSDPFETGVKAFSLSLNKAIVPFAFVLAPGIVLLRRKSNAAELPLRERYRVIEFADLLNLSYAIPEIVIPVIGVFTGVVALGITVIGTLYTQASPVERVGFASSSLLLMSPQLLWTTVRDVSEFLGTTLIINGSIIELILRGGGLAIFIILAVRNRRDAAI